MKTQQSSAVASPWPHRWAWLVCVATFPLVWVGGLITTTDAGMAVPDWPGTYGYNLFLYPWQTWLFGPWDLFIEHGHRLFASAVGLMTIGLCVACWRTGAPPRVRWLAVAALALVIGQGVLGGLRVVLNERVLAMLHGSTGPAFFGLTAAVVVVTASAGRGTAAAWRWIIVGLAYTQLVLGATLRHVPEDGSYNTFSQHVIAHLVGAALVTLAVLGSAVFDTARRDRRWFAAAMATVVVTQVGLGLATWVAKYRLPDWAHQQLRAPGVAADAWALAGRATTIPPVTAGGWGQTHTVTAHSATGSLLLALCVARATLGSRRRVTGANPAKTASIGTTTPTPSRPRNAVARPAPEPASVR